MYFFHIKINVFIKISVEYWKIIEILIQKVLIR